MLKQYRLRDYNFKLVFLVIVLSVIGIFAVGSANDSYQVRQVQGVILGLFLMVIISLFDYNIILKFYWILYVLNIILLIAVALQGVTRGGATRWINIFGVQFQPSETAKILIILFFAAYFMKREEDLNKLKYYLISIFLFIPVVLLIYKQPDMSTSIMVSLLFAIVLFEAGINWKYVLGLLAIIIPVFLIVLMLVLQPGQDIIEQYQQNRILAFINPEEYATSEAYQQLNSVMAIGSGQLHGKGYNSDDINSVKNGNFISEPQTDFIFAVIGEEFGFIGTCTIIVLLILISIECIIIARKAKDIGGTLIASGIGSLIAFQGFMNIGVATQVFPNTGIPLPFVSYGLTSLVSLYIGIGFVLNIRLQCNIKNTYERV